MGAVFRWAIRISPVLFLSAQAEQASCPTDGNAESICSGTPEQALDFIELADNLTALNRSVGNKLHKIRRIACSADWELEEEPVILEGCCWAMGSAFQKGEEVADCSNDEDFLPLDYFNISHQFFLEHCAEKDFTLWADVDHYQSYVTSLAGEPEEVQAVVDEGLRDTFNITLSELIDRVSTRRSMARYSAEKSNYQVHHRPKHVLGFFNPLTYGAMKSFWCPAMEKQLGEKGFPMPSLYRRLAELPWKHREARRESWEMKAMNFVVPARSSSVPPHLHIPTEVFAIVLMEGKKYWQFIPATHDSFSDLQPFAGFKGRSVTFEKAPIELVDEYPIYVGTQSKGEVIIPPRNWAHFVYSLEDSASMVFAG